MDGKSLALIEDKLPLTRCRRNIGWGEQAKASGYRELLQVDLRAKLLRLSVTTYHPRRVYTPSLLVAIAEGIY